MKWLLLLAAYLLGLLVFRQCCDLLTFEQAIAVSVLQAVLMLAVVCAFFKPHSTEVDHEIE
ncbi:hypothetical protein GCM10022631_02010 [Deinococcus rubellus]|uniref:Uncharacterized protein n=1 Tax=Deinococcus rubellus TaxID=1889240 RepID=A0ABY5YJ16_9DEIO|nr:hypothetical protein [Deinococcus rubellus]UWX64783.1 hypothetical protein N0D28_03730 [Deinococcus rubellus]